MLCQACTNNDELEVKRLLLKGVNGHKADISYSDYKAFILCLNKNNFSLLEFLLTSPLLEKRVNIHTGEEAPLFTAIHTNNMQLLNFLLTNPSLHEHSDVNPKTSRRYTPLSVACENGQMEMVEYLLTSKKLKYHADINAFEDKALICACRQGHLNIVEYLLTSKKLKKHSHLKAFTHAPLKMAIIGGHSKIVNYLISLYTFKDLKKFIKIQGDKLNHYPIWHELKNKVIADKEIEKIKSDLLLHENNKISNPFNKIKLL